MSTRKLSTSLFSIFTVTVLANLAFAVPTKVIHIDTPGDCDPLFIPDDVHEIGDFREFPSDEALGSANLGPSNIAPCPILNDTLIPDVVIDIRNLSGIDWHEVWYVADQETTITNFDGEANQAIPGLAPVHEVFRIDNLISDPGGSHHPLIGESMTADGIWEAGESWQFILQDYSNTLGLPPEAITSIGVGSASSVPTAVDASGLPLSLSSGSIIAITKIPEPSTCMLIVLGLTGMLFSRKGN